MTAPVDIGTLIVSTPGYVGGRPRIAGTSVAVATIATYWHRGYSAEDILNRAFPHLEPAQVYAALAYYFANRQAIDQRIAEDEAEYDRLAQENARTRAERPATATRRPGD